MKPDELPALPDVAAVKAEEAMFAEVLQELFLGALAVRAPEPWYEKAARRLSRTTSRKLLDSLAVAHEAGMRLEPRAAALAEAIDVLCVTGRNAAGPYDFPTELAVLVVSRTVADDVLNRVRAGHYHSADEVVGTAMHALRWAEDDPIGKSQLLKFAIAAGVVDADEGRLIPADVVFQRVRDILQDDAQDG